VAQSQWERADTAYRRLKQPIPLCWICSWRILEIGRWLTPSPIRARASRSGPRRLSPAVVPKLHSRRAAWRSAIAWTRCTRAEGSGVQLGRGVIPSWPARGTSALGSHPRVRAGRRGCDPTFGRVGAPSHGRPPPKATPVLRPAARFAGECGVTLDASHSSTRAPLQPASLAVSAESAAVRVTTESSAGWRQSNADFGAGPRLLPTFDVAAGAIALGEMLEKGRHPICAVRTDCANTRGGGTRRMERIRDLAAGYRSRPQRRNWTLRRRAAGGTCYVDRGASVRSTRSTV